MRTLQDMKVEIKSVAKIQTEIKVNMKILGGQTEISATDRKSWMKQGGRNRLLKECQIQGQIAGILEVWKDVT